MRMKDDVAATNCFARVVSLIFFPYFIHNCALCRGSEMRNAGPTGGDNGRVRATINS